MSKFFHHNDDNNNYDTKAIAIHRVLSESSKAKNAGNRHFFPFPTKFKKNLTISATSQLSFANTFDLLRSFNTLLIC